MSAIATILAQIGLPALIKIITTSVKDIQHPAATTASDALTGILDALKNGAITEADKQRSERLLVTLLKDKENTLAEVNKSLRSEVTSEDPYVRRMRPTFGYLMALTWTAQMLAIAYILIFKTDHAHIIIQSMQSLGTIWAVALSVLGIYVYKRSEDKKNDTQNTFSKTFSNYNN